MGPGAGGDPPAAGGAGAAAASAAAQHRRWIFALFVLPVAAVVFPVLYNHVHPELAGVPFFVWYQFVAVLFGAVVTGVVYLLRGTEKRVRATHAADARSPSPSPSSEPPARA
jgi:hypothetical protein